MRVSRHSEHLRTQGYVDADGQETPRDTWGRVSNAAFTRYSSAKLEQGITHSSCFRLSLQYFGLVQKNQLRISVQDFASGSFLEEHL